MIRRQLIKAGGIGSILSILSAVPVRAADSNTNIASLDELAQALSALPTATASERSAYVEALASHLYQLGQLPDRPLFPMGSVAPGIKIGPVAKTEKFVVIGYEALPHAKLPPHNHPNYSVVTLGVGGEVFVRYFDASTAPPMADKSIFHLEETRRVRLRAGDVATLTPDRNNIHTFEAGPQGARWLDFTSRHGSDMGFSYLKIEEEGEASLGTSPAGWWHANG